MSRPSTEDLLRDLTPGELRSEAAFIRRRVRALESAEKALRTASNKLEAAGDRDLADLLFTSWNGGDAALAEARDYLTELDLAAECRRHGAEPVRPAMQAAAA